MSLTKATYSMIDGATVNILDFGAVGDNSTDCTAAIQAAINSTNQPLAVYFPAGVYKVTSTITIDRDRIMLFGDGVASRVNFVPTADDVLFYLDKGVGATFSVVQCTVQNLAFFSSDSTYAKTAFLLIDISSCIFDNVQTLSPHWNGGATGSIFLHIRGRDSSSFKNLNVFADRPILISPDPDPSIIGIDHFNFHNIYIGNVWSTPYPLIEVVDGVALTQVSFTGYQAWVKGDGGFKMTDTTSAGVSNGLYFENVRYEGNDDPDNTYFIEINRSASDLQNLTITGGQTGNTKGIYLRKVRNVSIYDFVYSDAAREALNVDSTVYPIITNNCFWQSGSTATLVDGSLFTSEASTVSGPVVETGFYGRVLSATPQIINNATVASSTVNVATDGVLNIGTSTQISIVLVSVNGGGIRSSAIYMLRGAAGTVGEISDIDNNFSPTKDNASTINIYWDAGNARYEVQNKTASTVAVYVQRFGRS